MQRWKNTVYMTNTYYVVLLQPIIDTIVILAQKIETCNSDDAVMCNYYL